MNKTELIDRLSGLAAEEPGRSGGETLTPEDTAPDGSVYAARIYYIYKLALGIVTDEADKAELLRDFDEFCKVADTTSYDLGQGCRWVAEKCIALGELKTAMDFLGTQLFDLNKEAAVVVLSEENMLLYMMLEIALSEINNGNAKKGQRIFDRYPTVHSFRECYIKIKLYARRVWLGISHTPHEFGLILKEYPVSGEMLAVILKYSCEQDVWVDVFGKFNRIIGSRDTGSGRMILAYRDWLRSNGEGTAAKCREISYIDGGLTAYSNGLTVRRLMFSDGPAAGCEDSAVKDPHKLAIIFCTNDELYEAETIRYLETLKKPGRIEKIEVLPVWGGKSMASAYNFAMTQTDALYKLYIHHDTFIFEPETLNMVLKVFDDNPGTGMAGIAGSMDIAESARWFDSEKVNIRSCLYQDAVLNILRSVSIEKNGLSEEAAIMDGIFLATCVDVPWNEETFDNWHFYDISQCLEMKKRGYSCRFINADGPILLHETTMRKDPRDLYNKYRNIFKKTYNI